MNDTRDPNTELILQASRFWIQRVLVPITVVIGVAGNTITVMVLTRRRMRSSTNIYLSALAIADIIHLFFVLLLSFKHYSNIHDGKYELYWRFLGIMFWFCDAASSTSVWLTVSFTVERYIAVCHPIKGKFFCTETRAKSVIVIVYILCILTTASTSFEYQLNLNETCIQEDCETHIKKLQPTQSSLNNGTDNHYIINHTIMLNTNFPPGSIASHPNLDEKYFKKLKLIILTNCELQPCIIYIPPLALNVSKDKITKPDIIVKELDTDGSYMTSKIQSTLEPVLEKPPINSTTYLDSTDNKTELELRNKTCCIKHYTIDEESTSLGKNDTYMTIMYWYSSLCFCLIPLILIATFNSFLVRAVYLSQKMRRQMTNSQESIGHTNEKRITLMLIGVIILFIICHTPTASILIYNSFHKSKTSREENIKKVLGNFFNFLGIVNASCNFLLYCVFSKKFRSTFMKLFFERKKKKQDIIMLSSTKSRSSQKFNPYKHGIMRRNASEYQTPRNLETQSLTSAPRSTSLIIRPVGKAKSSDLIT
ncbi:FMRFamide receptor-like isoform X1 [Anoplophora glabripennis]|uniref:FMRFamide receptor-like isoform X1 n=1 Tax=Anoplophora glabripennis TaxID=217634 RepID=UPI000874EBE4|nr:FMRFamide receptor-like isoform X1 [Anoplophora glabripennis]